MWCEDLEAKPGVGCGLSYFGPHKWGVSYNILLLESEEEFGVMVRRTSLKSQHTMSCASQFLSHENRIISVIFVLGGTF